jgi:hypothetical protein
MAQQDALADARREAEVRKMHELRTRRMASDGGAR